MSITTAKGTVLRLSDLSSPTSPSYTAISEVRSITGPTTKPKVVDITTHDTPLNFMRKLSVLIDPGDLSFEFNFDPSDPTHSFATGMWAQMLGLTRCEFQMIFPNAVGSMQMKGFIGQHEFMVPVDNVLAVKMMFALTDNILASTP